MGTLPNYYTLDHLCPCSSTPSRSIPQFPSKTTNNPRLLTEGDPVPCQRCAGNGNYLSAFELNH
ncbi:hypothetical protein GmHk_14G040087 [Glycine max]|nr:hypothetical protein GmHk_14G040087 [Glycine max]